MECTTTSTNCTSVRGHAVEVDVRRWHQALYTLSAVRTAGAASGTDFEHYNTFQAARLEGLRVARAMLRSI